MNRARAPAFSTRSRCCSPCVGLISDADYGQLVAEAKSFSLAITPPCNRRSRRRWTRLQALDFERAARLRDRIRALTYVQGSQDINAAIVTEADVFAIHAEGGQACIQVFFFRAGQNWGNHAFFPKHDKEEEPADILDAFLAQFYDGRDTPR
ncbi:MAG: UvrB/UvrC motif-containing protein [Parvularculaceae bacterium]